jgi:hypothetical protein
MLRARIADDVTKDPSGSLGNSFAAHWADAISLKNKAVHKGW